MTNYGILVLYQCRTYTGESHMLPIITDSDTVVEGVLVPTPYYSSLHAKSGHGANSGKG